MLRGFLVLVATAALAAEATLDVRARIDRDEVEREIVRGGLLEDRRYDDAIDALSRVRERHPYAFAARFELGRRIADLEARRRSSEPAPAPGVDAE